MWIFSQRQWLTGAAALLLAAVSFALGAERLSVALADDTTVRAPVRRKSHRQLSERSPPDPGAALLRLPRA